MPAPLWCQPTDQLLPEPGAFKKPAEVQISSDWYIPVGTGCASCVDIRIQQLIFQSLSVCKTPILINSKLPFLDTVRTKIVHISIQQCLTLNVTLCKYLYFSALARLSLLQG